jgi:hypothetical protein
VNGANKKVTIGTRNVITFKTALPAENNKKHTDERN